VAPSFLVVNINYLIKIPDYPEWNVRGVEEMEIKCVLAEFSSYKYRAKTPQLALENIICKKVG
jgi:hypothetical protein